MLHNYMKQLRNINSRSLSSSSYLIDDPKYSFLKNDLNLSRINAGVYCGKWFGSGAAVKTIGIFFILLWLNF